MTEPRPMLMNLPDVIETDRLVIQIPKVGDGKAVNLAIQASLPELRRWVGWVHPVPSVDDSEEFVRRSIGQWYLRSQFSFLVRTKASLEVIGATGFHAIDWKLGRFETGYWCHTAHSGKGYTTEATRAMTKYAFDHLNATRLEIRCDAENVRSRKIPERLSYTLEAQLKHYNRRFDDNSFGTQLIYARSDANGID